MTAAWTLAPVPRITHAEGAVDRLGDALAGHVASGAAVLLVADPGLHASGAIERASRALGAGGYGVILFDGLKTDPTMAQTDAAAALAREHRVGAVVALGGGSALDVGKAVAAIAPASAPARHYALCANPLPARPLPKVCVPTTAGTGSETTRTSVLSTDDGTKQWLWGDAIKADEVVLDPTLSASLPPTLTAGTGIDAVVHAIEACTNRNAFAANDIFCHAAIGLAARWLRRAVEQPDDLEARSAMLLAAAYAGVGIDNAGTSVAHNIGHALASLRPVHHGRAVGLALHATLAWNAAQDDGRFAAAGRALGDMPLPAAFERLLREVGIKVSLGGEGHDDLTPEALAEVMASPANAPMRDSSWRKVEDADLLLFAHRVLTQS
jgi:alcohol dehydrogenase class IV